MVTYVQGINHKTLKNCRLQIGIPLERVELGIPKIREVEAGEKGLTFRQLDLLASMYHGPRWVLLQEEIPEIYDYGNTIPGFRKLKESPIAADPIVTAKINTIMARLDQLRSLVIDLETDLGQPIAPFSPPLILQDPIKTATNIRTWLQVPDNEFPPFETWRLLVEEKGILVFLTSKYLGWSHVDPTIFRGLSMYYGTLPIIVINDSDARMAQSFTLFHELGHLLRKKSRVYTWLDNTMEEKWCDMLAGSILIPSSAHLNPITTIKDLRAGATMFNVSNYAYLVRLRQLGIVGKQQYDALEQELFNEWQHIQEKRKQNTGGPQRIIPKEKRKQYGRVIQTLLQAYTENELSLVQTMRILELKKPDYLFELMET